VALAEKAYAQANGAGIVTTAYMGSDSYSALDGGQPAWALQAVTGKSASAFAINPTNIAAAWNAGELIVLGSSSNAADNLIVGDSEGTHAYAVVDYTASSSTPFELYNPWGSSSVVGSTVTYKGQQVYGGPFYANATLISQDFASQTFESGAVAGMGDLSNGGQEITGVLGTTLVPTANAHDREQADGSLANNLLVSANRINMDPLVAEPACTPLPSTLNADFACVDRILGALDEFDVYSEAGGLVPFGRRNALGKALSQSVAMKVSLAGAPAGYFP